MSEESQVADCRATAELIAAGEQIVNAQAAVSAVSSAAAIAEQIQIASAFGDSSAEPRGLTALESELCRLAVACNCDDCDCPIPNTGPLDNAFLRMLLARIGPMLIKLLEDWLDSLAPPPYPGPIGSDTAA